MVGVEEQADAAVGGLLAHALVVLSLCLWIIWPTLPQLAERLRPLLFLLLLNFRVHTPFYNRMMELKAFSVFQTATIIIITWRRWPKQVHTIITVHLSDQRVMTGQLTELSLLLLLLHNWLAVWLLFCHLLEQHVYSKTILQKQGYNSQ